MKLRSLDTRPPQSLRVTLDAATHDKLTAYVTYAAAQGQRFKDIRQLLTEIARAFVEHGDKGFAAWYRARQETAAVLGSVLNGGASERPARLTPPASSVLSAGPEVAQEVVQEVAGESGEGDQKAR
jgi:hypothetical protein